MFDKAKDVFEGLRLKAGVWNRERKERAEERRAAKAAEQALEPAGTPSASLVKQVKLGAWGAYFALMYFLWERVLHVSESQFETLRITNFLWFEEIVFHLHFPLIIGYVFVVLTVPYIAKFAIPMMVNLSFREHPVAKLWAIFITILVSVVLISGTATVGGMAVVESERESAVAVAQVEQGAATLAAQIADVQHAMDERTRSESVYVRTAASMSPAAYDRFVEARRGDWQYDRLRSYRAVSEEMVALNVEMSRLRGLQSRQQVAASVSSEVVTSRSAPIAGILGWLNAFWILLLAVVMDIACLFLPWLAETLQQRRNRMMGFAAEAVRSRWDLIEDKQQGRITPETVDRRTAQEMADMMIEHGADPRWAAHMARATQRGPTRKTTIRDAQTDETIVDKDGHLATIVREHTRKVKGKDGKPVRIMVPAEPAQPDEVGVNYDGGARTATPRDEQAMSGAMVEERESAPAPEPFGGDVQTSAEQASDRGGDRIAGVVAEPDANQHPETQGEAIAHSEPPEPTLTEDQQAELNQSLAALGELEPTAEAAGDQSEQHDATDEERGDDEPGLVADSQVTEESFEHDEPQEERVEPRALLPAK